MTIGIYAAVVYTVYNVIGYFAVVHTMVLCSLYIPNQIMTVQICTTLFQQQSYNFIMDIVNVLNTHMPPACLIIIVIYI